MEPGSQPSTASHSYDVVIIGGAVAGASTAILLKRRMPELKVLVVEKSDRFDWKVGESHPSPPHPHPVGNCQPCPRSNL
jgi:thioredoxin reductase